MDLRHAKRILIFGGTFDPPHVAHVRLPMLAADALDADAVAYVPTWISPHKDSLPTPPEHRVAMLRIALRNEPRASILTDEIDRAGDGGPSYTVDTLETLRDRLGSDAEMRLLIGTDQVLAFDRWHRAERVAELAEPAVMVRPPHTRDSILKAIPDPETWCHRLVELPAMDVSATKVRRRLMKSESTDGLLDPAVRAYIDEHGLYRPDR